MGELRRAGAPGFSGTRSQPVLSAETVHGSIARGATHGAGRLSAVPDAGYARISALVLVSGDADTVLHDAGYGYFDGPEVLGHPCNKRLFIESGWRLPEPV